MKSVVIAGALRTSIGYFRGVSAGHSAVELGSLVVRALVERTDVPAYAADEVILGQVLTAGAGQSPARQSTIKGGSPNSVFAITTNDACGSELKALHLATQAIQRGRVDIVIAGGQENMSRAPHILTDSHTDAQLDSSQLVDSLVHDGLRDVFNDYRIDATAKNLIREYGINRQLQDAYALSPQQKTRAAIDAGRLKDETVPAITQSNEQALATDTDEQPCTDISVEALAHLNPSFDSLGSVTAGSASSINDGTAAVMMMSEAKARVLDSPALVCIHALASVGVDPALMGVTPMCATRRCLEHVGWQLADVDLIEANEVFAAQALSTGKVLEWDERRVNINGGVTAFGHPIGTPGCRILVSLVHEMVERSVRKGLAMPCIGGGQGVTLIIERDEQLCISSLSVNICRH